MRRKKKLQMRTRKSRGSTQLRTSDIHLLVASPVYFTPWSSRSSTSFGSSIRTVVKLVLPWAASFSVPWIWSIADRHRLATLPARTSDLNSL